MRRNQGLKARFGVFVKCHFGNQATVLLLPPLRCKIIIIIIVVIITTVAVMFTSRIRANKWWGDQVLLILLMFLLWLSLCFPLEGDSGLILLLSSFFLVSLFFSPLYGLFLNFFFKFFWWFDRYEMCFLVLLFWFFWSGYSWYIHQKWDFVLWKFLIWVCSLLSFVLFFPLFSPDASLIRSSSELLCF